MNTSAHPLQAAYLAQRRSGDLNAAAATLQKVLGADPRADWAYNEFIELLVALGRRGDAEKLARTALRVNPHNAQAHNLFGTLLSELNDLPSGEWHFRRAIELGGGEPRLLTNLALNLMQQGRTDAAEEFFAAADAGAPDNFQTLAYWSKLCEVTGDLPRAMQLLQRAQAVAGDRDLDLLQANHLARTGRPAEALAILDAAGELNGDARLERGRLLDRLGHYAQAWPDLVAGKRQLATQAGGLTYHTQGVEDFFARLKRFFVRANIALLPQAPLREGVPQPVFVMGFPRSGTTLIEQVISSHSAIRAGGELPFLIDVRRLANHLFPSNEPFPENLAHLWTADNRYGATLFRDHYFARAEQAGLLDASARYFTDKMPFNEIWLPVLRMAFPHARIIRVVRHPLDICVSMLSNNLTHGFNCGYRMEDIVHHLAAVHDLVEHYRREMQYDELVLRYESFVGAQLPETHRLLDYLGLPFEETCLRFHESRRYAPTPSYAQVTERLNDRSIGRYAHYREQLLAYVAKLRPLMTAYGYEE
jgi:Tfp pilus assembly protein PilF